jgi:hypothetical protein
MSKENKNNKSSKLLYNYSIPSTPYMALTGWQYMQSAYITQPHPHPNHTSVNCDLILSPEDGYSFLL